MGTSTRGIAIHCGGPGRNSNHDFHDRAQYIVLRTLNDASVKAWIVHDRRPLQWYGELLHMCGEHLQVRILDHEDRAQRLGLTVVPVSSLASTRKISDKWQRRLMIRSIQAAAWSRLGMQTLGSRPAVLYTRNDTTRRRLVQWENVACHFDRVVHNLSIPFTEQVRIFVNARLHVAPNGANMINIIFMPSDATVIDIQTKHMNSWQVMYGTYIAVKHYLTPLAKERQPIALVNPKRTHADDDDILVDWRLRKEICRGGDIDASTCGCKKKK